jgi:hypothetical protein
MMYVARMDDTVARREGLVVMAGMLLLPSQQNGIECVANNMTPAPTAPLRAASAAAQRHAGKATNAAAVAQAVARTLKHAANTAVPTLANPAAVLNINATALTSNAAPATAARPRTQPVVGQNTTARQAQRAVLVPRKTVTVRMIISALLGPHVLTHFILI